jgi:hypothetical protein
MRAATLTRGLSGARAAKAALPSLSAAELVYFDELASLDPLDDKLSDLLAVGDDQGRLGVEIDRDDLDLAPIVAINEPWGVHERQAIPQRTPTTWLHESCVAFRKRKGHSRGYERAVPRQERGGASRKEVKTSVAVMSVAWKREVFVDSANRKTHVSQTPRTTVGR